MASDIKREIMVFEELGDLANGPLARYVKLRVADAPGMPGTFTPPPRNCAPDMHHGTCVTHVPWCMPGSLTNVEGKRSRYSRRMRNPQFDVSGKRPMVVSRSRDICNPGSVRVAHEFSADSWRPDRVTRGIRLNMLCLALYKQIYRDWHFRRLWKCIF